MSETPKEIFEAQSRVEARALAQDGLAAMARAFNHCDNPELAHRYSMEVQLRFRELAVELVRLVEVGDIEPNPGHRRHLQALAARRDATLQATIRKASRKTRIRG